MSFERGNLLWFNESFASGFKTDCVFSQFLHQFFKTCFLLTDGAVTILCRVFDNTPHSLNCSISAFLLEVEY